MMKMLSNLNSSSHSQYLAAMKPIYLLSVCTLTIFVACKKDKQPVNPTNPPGNSTWKVSTIAGSGQPFFSDGPAFLAGFRDPVDVTVSKDGKVYIADPLTHRIRMISNNAVSTLAGDGTSGITDGVHAQFELPSMVIADDNNNIYTLDIDDPRVRKISPTGFVSSIAGNGQVGFRDGLAADAEFGKEMSGMVMDAQGNILVVDFDNKRIRKITIGGQVITIAGNGQQGYVDGPATTAEFFAPSGIALDKNGNIFIGDGNRVRKINTNGVVSTYTGRMMYGFHDGTLSDAVFTSIEDLVINDEGDLYLTDQNRIREVGHDGIVSTIAGGDSGYRDGEGTTAEFYSPAGLGIDKDGSLFIADVNNYRIRKLSKQ